MFLKEVELNLISELMKNSRRSDRELARAVGASQPTITRARLRLEKEGLIAEYTMIPEFSKLEFDIAALTFVKFKGASSDECDSMRKRAQHRFKNGTFGENVVMFVRGMGLGYTGVMVSFHKDYSSFSAFSEIIKRQYPIVESTSFLIDLKDDVRYRPLTFATLAKHILMLKKSEPGVEQ
jgi:DNA-binding Lrp family transcriptional regulator